jgi:hypothetical protein
MRESERVYTSERPGDKLSRRAADESASFFSAIKCLRVHHMQCAFLNCCRGKLFNCAAGHAENCSSSASVRHGRTTRGILPVFRYSSHTYTHGGGCETKRWEFRDAAVWCCKWFQLLFAYSQSGIFLLEMTQSCYFSCLKIKCHIITTTFGVNFC